MRKQVELLEYHPHLLAVAVDIRLLIGNIGSLKQDMARCRLLQSV